MPDKMTREEAIEIGNKLLKWWQPSNKPLFIGHTPFPGERICEEAIKSLLSTAKKYGDVVGIVKKEVDKLESRESLTGEQYMILLDLRWFLTLLTEEE